jgi:hypothetical protein
LVVREQVAEPYRLVALLAEKIVHDEKLPGIARLDEVAEVAEQTVHGGASRFALVRAELTIHAAAADSLDGIDRDSGVADEREIRIRETVRSRSRARGRGMDHLSISQIGDA